MNRDELEALLLDLESDRVERTVSREKPDKIGEAICAFANDMPGESRPEALPSGRDRTVSAHPRRAVHEILMNAVIHRNYEGSTTPVIVNHFHDRLEIRSPGGLYGDLTEEVFPDGTSYRNPILAEAAKTLGFVNRYGRGIALAQELLLNNGSPPAEFKISSNQVAVTLRRRP